MVSLPSEMEEVRTACIREWNFNPSEVRMNESVLSAVCFVLCARIDASCAGYDSGSKLSDVNLLRHGDTVIVTTEHEGR